MALTTLNRRAELNTHEKLNAKHAQFEKLISELNKRDIPSNISAQINDKVDQINDFSGPIKEWGRLLRKSQSAILKLVEKELKLVPKGYYRMQWLALGMTIFGVPMGVAFSMALGSMAFIGLGFPIGMAIGIAIGSGKDKEAADKGNQLDLEIK